MASDLFYRVTVDAAGTAYDLSGDLASFTVEQRESEPDLCTIEIPDPYTVFSHALQEGMSVEAELGTVDDHSVLFRGRIYRLRGTFPADGLPVVKVHAYDRTMAMGLRRRNRTWVDMTLSEVVDAIASQYFSDTYIAVRGDPHFGRRGLRQEEETDLAFLLRLAAAHGCVLYSRAGDQADTFHFIAHQEVMSAEPELTLYHARTGVPYRLLHFEASADVSRTELPRILAGIDFDTGRPTDAITTEVMPAGDTGDAFHDERVAEFRGREPVKAAQLELLVSAAAPVRTALREELGTAERDATPVFTSDAELRERAKNQFSTRLHGMSGSGTLPGVQSLVARTSVAIADVGGRFSGTWYLSEVRHVYNQNGYRTEFECRR